MEINLNISVDAATPQLANLVKNFEGREPMFRAAGYRLVRDTANHVRNWGLTHPNQLGGRRTNYWALQSAKINPADTLDASSSGATMTLSGEEIPGITRAFGDVVIVPGTKTPGVKYIPVPARAESYGLRPREISGLVLFWRGKGKPGGLAEGVTVTRTRDSKKGKKGTTYLAPGLVMYWFADSVTQPQDRTLLPSEEQWSESATAGAREWVDLQIAKSKSGGNRE